MLSGHLIGCFPSTPFDIHGHWLSSCSFISSLFVTRMEQINQPDAASAAADAAATEAAAEVVGNETRRSHDSLAADSGSIPELGGSAYSMISKPQPMRRLVTAVQSLAIWKLVHPPHGNRACSGTYKLQDLATESGSSDRHDHCSGGGCAACSDPSVGKKVLPGTFSGIVFTKCCASFTVIFDSTQSSGISLRRP